MMKRKRIHVYKVLVFGTMCAVLLSTGGMQVGLAQSQQRTPSDVRALLQQQDKQNKLDAIKLEEERKRRLLEQQKQDELRKQREGNTDCKVIEDNTSNGVRIQAAVPINKDFCFSTVQDITIAKEGGKTGATVEGTRYRVCHRSVCTSIKILPNGRTDYNASGSIRFGKIAAQTDCNATQEGKLSARCTFIIGFKEGVSSIDGRYGTDVFRSQSGTSNPEFVLNGATNVGKYIVEGNVSYRPENNQIPVAYYVKASRTIEVDGIKVTGSIGHTNKETCNGQNNMFKYSISGEQKIGSFATVSAGVDGSPCTVARNVGISVPVGRKFDIGLGYSCTTVYNDPSCLNQARAALNLRLNDRAAINLQATSNWTKENKFGADTKVGATFRINTN